MSLEGTVQDLFNQEELQDFCAWCITEDYHIEMSLEILKKHAMQDIHYMRSYGSAYDYIGILEGNLPTVAEVINNEYK